MKTHFAAIMALLLGILFPQAEINFSYEMKYGDDLENQTDEKYNYFENLLDINTYYSDNVYAYTQFEYSVPPIFGHSIDGLNAFYMEYTNEKFNIKLGDINYVLSN